MTEEAQEDAPRYLPYVPFPAFVDWVPEGLDLTTYERFRELLDRAKAEASSETLHRVIDTASKWAAVDTGAIEGLYDVDRGFTITVAAGAAAWDNIHKAKGESVERAIRDALAGYEYVMDLATQSRPVTEQLIKELHATLCASQDKYEVITAVGPQEHALPKGEYKQHPNNPFNLASNTVHSYAPVEDTSAEMGRLANELRSTEFEAAHPILQAAYAHYAFVCIHPFADGNGRVSRALGSVYLYRNPGVPLVIFADQKDAYISSLEAADAGDSTPFIEFVRDRAVDTVRMVEAEFSRTPSPPIDERLATFQKSMTGKYGIPHQEIDALAAALLDTFHAEFRNVLAENPLDAGFSAQVNIRAGGPAPRREGFRAAPDQRVVSFDLNSAAPASAKLHYEYRVQIALPSTDEPELVVVGGARGEFVLEAFIRDLRPAVSTALSYRARVAASEEFMFGIGKLMEAGQQKLKQLGYLD